MSNDMQLLIDEIEARRQELVQCAQNLNDPDTLKLSQRLDVLINKYYEMTESILLKKRA